MLIHHLSLLNFRNYARLEVGFPPGRILLVGDNAQGKTSLLEAIYVLATTRSPHASTDRQMLNWFSEKDELSFTRLQCNVERNDGSYEIEIILTHTSQPQEPARLSKRIRVNGAPRRALDLIGTLYVVLFSPEDLDLVTGGPAMRRRYLDAALCQLDVRYCRSLGQYNQILSQRNSLLRRLQERHGGREQLAFWDQRLVEEGSYLWKRRLELTVELDKGVQHLHAELTGGREFLQLIYESSVETAGTPSPAARPTSADYMVDNDSVDNDGAADPAIREARSPAAPSRLSLPAPELAALKTQFTARLQALQDEEVMRGVTLVGPHRDDLRFTVNGADCRLYGSRGQQRTAILALKLAEADVFRQDTGQFPILLLDDVLSELDESRRAFLIDHLTQYPQTLITSTNLADFPPGFAAAAHVLRVDAGCIEHLPVAD